MTAKKNIPRGKWVDPIVPREDEREEDSENLTKEILASVNIPDGFDLLADGVLMKHQIDWIADTSILKLCAKGRRTGITFAEAQDCTLIAAAKRGAGGQNVFYIGDTKDKGREFIGYVAHFAKTISKDLISIEEGLFIDQRADGTTKHISTYIVRFISGYRVEALSSRPENIRGLQGVVVIDEAAFHKDIRNVLDAVNALLIWGGKVRVISSHNGNLNPFNELIREARAGKVNFSVHEIPFSVAVENGLYKRVCLMSGKTWSKQAEEEWEAEIRAAYGVRKAKMRQELDAIPADAEGAALSRVQIEACTQKGIPVIRWACDDDFKNAPDDVRTRTAMDFCKKKLAPVLAALDPRRAHYFGEDFARLGDATVIMPMEMGRDLVRRVVLQVELRNMPFDQQREILFYVVDRLPNMSGGALDARGNGAYLAEKAAQRYGSNVVEVQLSDSWYKTEMPAYLEAFADKTIVLPADEDTVNDHQSLAYVNGYVKVPDNHRMKGSDGFNRHGDSAIAGALGYFATRSDVEIFNYTPASEAKPDGNPLFKTEASFTMLPSLTGGLY